ncbi:hypothetical protein ABPG77_008039 [Micractinium sp. CCAP 211/92]
MADPGRVWWLLTAVACQFVWGIYPAALRFLQTKADEPLTSLQLSFLINLLACPALLLGSTIPSAVRTALARRRRREPTAGPAAVPSYPLPHAQHPPAPLPGSSAGGEAAPSKTRVPVADSALAQPLLGPEDPEEQQPGAAVAAARPAWATPWQPDQEGATPGTKPELAHPLMATSPPGPSSPAAGRGAQAEHAAQPGWRRQAAVLAGTTFFLSSLLLAQVFSLLFTTAYLSQMVFLLAPVIVALLARALFRQPLPPGLWPALFLMLLGCGMVIGSKAAAAAGQHAAPPPSTDAAGRPVAATGMLSHRVGLFARRGEEAWLCVAAFGGTSLARLCAPDPGNGPRSGQASLPAEAAPQPDQWPAARPAAALQKKKRRPPPGPPPPAGPPAGPPGLGPRDAFGILLSFLGACCLAGFMLVVQRCGNVVSNQQVLWANFLAQSALCFVLLCCFERDRLRRLLHLGMPELGAVAALAGGINWGANLVQQVCIQRLGAPATAAFLPVRLLGSLAASYPLLSEGLEGPAQWGGCAVLLAAVSWYLTQQKKAAAHSAATAAFEADVAAGGADTPSMHAAGEP